MISHWQSGPVQLPPTDLDFLRSLVKTSRQRPEHVRWTDRDGTARITTLSLEDSRRIGELARQLGLSKDTLLRRAAELPALKKPENPPSA